MNWSFNRVDISRKEQAFQIALALSDEVHDLEVAGCKVIQMDEPALREAMPLRNDSKDEYLDWTVDAFRLSTAIAAPATQIHTHMCYCEFSDCMDAIDRLDTDVNSIENARSDDATLRAFQDIGYQKGLGPGVYDIHSPVVPPVEEMYTKMKSFLDCMDPKELVINPDCGLKVNAIFHMLLKYSEIINSYTFLSLFLKCKNRQELGRRRLQPSGTWLPQLNLCERIWPCRPCRPVNFYALAWHIRRTIRTTT